MHLKYRQRQELESVLEEVLSWVRWLIWGTGKAQVAPGVAVQLMQCGRSQHTELSSCCCLDCTAQSCLCSWGPLAFKLLCGVRGDAPLPVVLAGPSAFQLVALGLCSQEGSEEWQWVLCELCCIPVQLGWSVCPYWEGLRCSCLFPRIFLWLMNLPDYLNAAYLVHCRSALYFALLNNLANSR